MVPVRRRLARDFTCGEEVGDHLGSSHGRSRS
jgi:biotin operon repressor